MLCCAVLDRAGLGRAWAWGSNGLQRIMLAAVCCLPCGCGVLGSGGCAGFATVRRLSSPGAPTVSTTALLTSPLPRWLSPQGENSASCVTLPLHYRYITVTLPG